jgi:hypothetical protein
MAEAQRSAVGNFRGTVQIGTHYLPNNSDCGVMSVFHLGRLNQRVTLKQWALVVKLKTDAKT